MEKFASREHMRDELHKTMPTVVDIVKDFREVFGDVRVTYAEEGKYKVGTPMNVKRVGVAHDGAIVVTYADKRRDA